MNVPQDPINPHVVVYSFDAPFAEYFNSYQRGGYYNRSVQRRWRECAVERNRRWNWYRYWYGKCAKESTVTYPIATYL